MAGLDGVHSGPVLGTHRHKGLIPSNYWAKLEGVYANNTHRYWNRAFLSIFWGEAAFISNFASCFQTHAGFLFFPVLILTILIA